MRNKLNKVFFDILHLKCIKVSHIAVINDKNNFAPSFFPSLCESVGDLDLGILLRERRSLSKYLGPKQSPLISHNDLKKKVGSYLGVHEWD